MDLLAACSGNPLKHSLSLNAHPLLRLPFCTRLSWQTFSASIVWLLSLDATLAVGQSVAAKASAGLLLSGRLRPQIAGRLLHSELTKGLVGLERINDSLAVSPGTGP